MGEAELSQTKQALATLRQIDWHIIDGKDGVLVYSDKAGVNISRSKLASQELAKMASSQE